MADFPNEFKSFEEMESFLESETKKPLTGRKEKVTPPAKQDSDISILTTVGLEIPLDQVYQVLHVYQRPGVSFTDVKREAKDEAAYKNNNVRVIAHGHSYGDSCGGSESKCRVIIGSAEDSIS